MRLVDFHIGAYGSYKPNLSPAESREINRLCRPVGEAIRMELAVTHVTAPCAKMAVELIKSGEPIRDEIMNALSVLSVPVLIEEKVLFGPVDGKNRALLDAVNTALDEAESRIGWTSGELRSIVRGLYGRDPICRVEWNSLSKRDRKTGLKLVVIYEVTESYSALIVEFRDGDEAVVRTEPVARSDEAFEYDFFFPVRSTVLQGRRMVFRDRKRAEIGTIDLDRGALT